MFGLEYIGIAAILLKYFLLLLVGFKLFQLLSDLLNSLTDEPMASGFIALLLSLFAVFLIREMFWLTMIAVLLFLYFFGWIGALYRFLKR